MYGAVPDSAAKASKWKRWRVISWGDPSVAVTVASEPSASSREAVAQSSTSMSLTLVVARQKTRRGGPATKVSMSSACTAWDSSTPPSSVAHRPRHGAA